MDDEDLQNTSLSTAASSSRFLKSLPTEAPEVPLRPLFAELHDVRWLMAEMAAESVLVTISLDLPEIGVRGEAVVTGLEPCPAILPGPGKVVLTTFHHASSDLIDLYLSPQPPSGVNSPSSTHLTSTSSSPTDPLTTLQTSEEALLYPRASRATSIDPSWERIGVTGNHPIWSQDRHDYVAAMDLRLGERLKNLSGDTVWVQQKLPRPGPTPVYNLEVQDEHVYYVGASGVLAHNSTGCDAPIRVVNKNSRDFLGESHVYVIKAPDGTVHKVGKSSAGTRVRDGASKRAESQVRKLNREDIANGGFGGYRSQIRKAGLPTSGDALDYEKRWRETFRRLFGDDKLPGNREHLRG